MSAEYVRRYYGVDYKRGDRLTVEGRPGTLISFPGQYLGIRFDGEKRTSRAHPTWEVARETPTGREPLPEVQHKGEGHTDAAAFAQMARNLCNGYHVGGSNARDALVRLIYREIARSRKGTAN